MGENTKISWATHTFNAWHGCSRVEGSPACGPTEEFPDGAICYAETFSNRVGYNDSLQAKSVGKFPIWGAHEKRRFFGDKHWAEPLKWNREASLTKTRARVFCMSMGDWAEGRPDQAEHLLRLWGLIQATPWLDWLMLTKRPQLIAKLCPLAKNKRVWQGITTETQKWLDLRWRIMHDTVESEIYWLSIEPMFEALRLPRSFLDLGPRGWVITGGQSGPRTTYMDPAWPRELRDQCLEAGVRFHHKQMSGNTKAALENIPPDLMIREYPEAR